MSTWYRWGNVVSPPVPPTPPQPGLTSASVDNGIVYFTAANGISALRAGDGKQLWHIQTFLIDPPIVAGGVVYARDFGGIFALRGSDGVQLWQYPFFVQAIAQPVQVIGDRVYLYDGQGLSVLIAGSGIRVWSTNDPVDVIDINTLTINNGVVYYAVHNKNSSATADEIYARRALDGKILWTYGASVAGQPCTVATVVSVARALDAIYASETCNNGTGRTFALRASDGALLWQFSMSGQFSVTDGVVCLHITQASPALADLYVLQASTGKLLWNDLPGTSQHQTRVWTPGNGYVYLLDNGTLSARRLSDGQQAWTNSTPSIST